MSVIVEDPAANRLHRRPGGDADPKSKKTPGETRPAAAKTRGARADGNSQPRQRAGDRRRQGEIVGEFESVPRWAEAAWSYRRRLRRWPLSLRRPRLQPRRLRLPRRDRKSGV